MIRTFIFFDLETTGLIGRNFMPKVTEMALIAVSRNDICNTMDELPRVLHKLVLPIHPKVDISKEIKKLTGLSNENLAEVQDFNSELCDIVMKFINRQAVPACFVAYNGDNFDYPIFLSELKNINKDFSKDILSIDMLHLVKDFYKTKEESLKKLDAAQISTTEGTDVNVLLNDGYDKILSDALDSIMKTHIDNHKEGDSPNDKSMKNALRDNSGPSTPETNCYKKMQEINEKTPENQIIKLKHHATNFQSRIKRNARRRLNFTSSKPSNFKLLTVCRHILGTDPENAHSAEGDCLTMIRCAIQLGDFFVEWADNKAVTLNNHNKR